jgi:signal transduction histidine kinase
MPFLDWARSRAAFKVGGNNSDALKNLPRLHTFAAVVISAIILFGAREQLVARVESIVMQHARVMASHTEQSFKAADILLGVLSADLRGQNLSAISEKAGQDMLRTRMSGALAQVRNMSIMDADGRQLFLSTEMIAGKVSVADRDYFLKLKAGAKTSVSGPYIGRNTNRPTFALAHRIDNDRGEMTGLAHAAIQPEFFEEFCLTVRPFPGLHTALISETGKVIATCDRGAPFVTRPIGDLLQFQPAFFLLSLVPAVRSEQPLADYPLRVVVSLSGRDFAREWLWEWLSAVLIATLFLTVSAMVIRHYRRASVRTASDMLLLEQLVSERTKEIEGAKQRFGLAMEMSKTVAFTMDRHLRFTWVHSSQVGFGGHDGLGKTEYDHFTKESADRLTKLYRGVMENGTRSRQDINLQSLFTDCPQDFDIVVEPHRDANGEIIGIIAAATDISVRKQTEKTLKLAKAEAERAVLARSKFLAAASHDLRQPVQSLALILGVLAAHEGAPAVTKAVGLMENALEGLNGLLTSILDLSRLDAGVVMPQIAVVDIGALLGRLAQDYTLLAETKGLQVKAVLPAVMAPTDSALLERVVRNFIENAIRYTSSGGILLGLRRRGNRVRIEVVDSGIGIPTDKLPHIFEEFYQVGNPGRDRQQGLGLGLAIVGRISRLLGAEVEVKSREGHGTSFSLLLPLDRAQCQPAEKGDIGAPNPS